MALPNEIQSGRINAVLHKLLNISEGSPSPSLATDVFPTITVESDRPEWHFLSGAKLVSAYATKAAAVGENGIVALVNPTNSGVIAVTELMSGWGGAGGVNLYPIAAVSTVTALTAGGTHYVRDLRFTDVTGSFFERGTCKLYYGNLSPISPSVHYVQQVANVTWSVTVPWVLPPGTAILWRMAGTNLALTVNYTWRERKLEPSETR